MSAAYKQVIAILMEGSLNYKDMVVELAKHNPDTFLAIHALVGDSAMEPWVKDAARQIKGNNKIEAIKIVRTNTGLGLKEAKDVVDVGTGYYDSDVMNTPNLSTDQKRYVTNLRKALNG